MPPADELLTPAEREALTRLAEAAISASAEVLSDLVLHTVRVGAPELSTGTWEQMQERFRGPMLVVRVEYVSGVVGSNLLLMEAEDARAIAAMMMAEELTEAVQLDELHLSALAEAMNQMMGTSATALSNLLQRRIEMSPPVTRLRRVGEENEGPLLSDDGEGGALVVLSFPMRIDDDQMGTVQSRVLQVFPVGFARRLAGDYLQATAASASASSARPAEKKGAPARAAAEGSTAGRATPAGAPAAAAAAPRRSATAGAGVAGRKTDSEALAAERWGPDLPLDEGEEQPEDRISMAVIKRITVPVTVRLGQAYLPLQDVLSLTRGSVVALDVAEGQPVDVLASGTLVARGEVVVVREHFGVRITEVVRPESS